nr:hypothetical protein [Tanacetum cinerariifolium]
MLDRTDFASWKQRIRLYCWGKENRVNILKSIDKGPFLMGTLQETLAEGIEDIYTLINHYTNAKYIWDNVKMLLEGFELTKEDRESQLYDDLEHFHHNKRETIYDYYVHLVMGELRTELGMQIQVKQGRLSVTTAMENEVALDEEQLLIIAGGQDNAYDCDAFNSDVDEAPTAQTMFMANLLSAYPVYDEASPSYDSNILSEVPDHDNYQDDDCEHHEVHEMHDDVQPNYFVDSHTDYVNDSNMIPYD